MSSLNTKRNMAPRPEVSSPDPLPFPHRHRPGREVVIKQNPEGSNQAREAAENRPAPLSKNIDQQKKYSSTHTATHTVTMTRTNSAGNYEAPVHQPPPGASTPQDQARNNSTDNRTTSGNSACQGHSTYEGIICGGSSFQWNGNVGTHHENFKDNRAGDNGVQWNGGFAGLSKTDVEGLRVMAALFATKGQE